MIAAGPRAQVTALDTITSPAHSSRSPAPGCPAGSARVVRVAGPALPYDRTYHLLGRLDKIRSLVRDLRPDVIEAHSPYLAAAAVVASGRRAARVRTAFWHSDHLTTYVTPRLARWLGRQAGERVGTRLWGSARALLAPFAATFVAGRAQEAALRRAGVKNVISAPFGVDVGTFRPEAASTERRRELGDEQDGERCAVLVAVGRLSCEKRWDVVIDAFAMVRTRLPAVLAVFGDGPERARLERRAPPGVTFFGFETDRRKLASAIASADVLVHGCPCETFGLGIADAVACAVPVVVPDEGGAVERVDPSCSETYRSLDVEACAASIERVLLRRGPELRARALEAASRVPTVDQHFAGILSAYGDLLRLERSARAD